METIILKPLFHRNMECIGIYFTKNSALQSIIQKQVGGRWSRTQKCWYVSCTQKNYEQLAKALKGKVILETGELRKYLLEKKKTNPVTIPASENKTIVKKEIKKIGTTPQYIHNISKENKEALQQFTRQLTLKAYSQSTIRTYTNEFTQFLNTIKEKPASGFSVSRLKDYFQYCHTTLKLSEATIHSRINTLKFYYEKVLGREKFFWEIPRPKKHNQLPKVLSENEIGRMFNAIGNIKHKAILFTAYSAGLRVSEVANLKIKDVDSDRMQLFIEKAKGKKDRYVGLSILLLDVLRAYLKSCKPMPLKYVFENPQRPGEAYSVRSAQQIFQDAKEKAKINKDVGIHSLRHSFATHLLEKGIDIRYIKDLLGHLSIKTTEKYLHVKKETLINIPNVLDELNKNITLDW
ncbi:MAG TPA: tyrosine-type recombinase/integrase [Hanamia sp.]